MAPTQEGFGLGHLARFDVNDGLEAQLKLLLLDRRRELQSQVQPVLLVTRAFAAGPLLRMGDRGRLIFCQIHRLVRDFDQLVDVVPVLGKDRHPDAGLQVDQRRARIVHPDGAFQVLLQAPGPMPTGPPPAPCGARGRQTRRLPSGRKDRPPVSSL